MPQKTESTEESSYPERTTSILSTSSRQLYRETQINPTIQPLLTYHLPYYPQDIFILKPSEMTILSWPEVYYLDDDITVSLRGNYYVFTTNNQVKLIERHCETSSELLHFIAEMPGKTVFAYYIERYLYKGELSLHFNTIRYDHGNNYAILNDYYCRSNNHYYRQEVWDFAAITTIENCKKAVMVVKVFTTNKTSYKILLLNLLMTNTKSQCENNKGLIIAELEMSCGQNFAKEQENFLKLVKSEFGDMLLICTSEEIYELDVEESNGNNSVYHLLLKPYNFWKLVDNETKREQLGSNNVNEEHILDVEFMSNGLRIMVLTTASNIVVLEAKNILWINDLSLVMTSAEIDEKYLTKSLKFTKIYAVNGSVAIMFDSNTEKTQNLERKVPISTQQRLPASTQQKLPASTQQKLPASTQQKLPLSPKTPPTTPRDNPDSEHHDTSSCGLLIIRVQPNCFISWKLISLPLSRPEILKLSIQPCPGYDELLFHYIDKKLPNKLEAYRCRFLVTELNIFTPLSTHEYCALKDINCLDKPELQLTHCIPFQELPKKYTFSHIVPSCGINFLLSDRSITCYFIPSPQSYGLSTHKLFTLTFFERPLKISVSPLTLQFAIIFREFIKFFYFNYFDAKQIHTLQLKHVGDVTYTLDGNAILLACNDGTVHIINPYTFTEHKLLDIHCEPIYCMLFEQCYLLVKSAKNVLSSYLRSPESEEFEQLYELKIDDNDLYLYIDQTLLLIKSKGIIEHYQPPTISLEKTSISILPNGPKQIQQPKQPELLTRLNCASYLADEIATAALIRPELGVLLVSTSKGNIKQYLWPLQVESGEQKYLQVHTQRVGHCKIIGMELNANFSRLGVSFEDGTMLQTELMQYINGKATMYVYVLSKKLADGQLKWEYSDRSSILEQSTPTETYLVQELQGTLEELEFIIEKTKDDLDELTRTHKSKLATNMEELKMDSGHIQADFIKEMKELESISQTELEKLKESRIQLEQEFATKRETELKAYEKSILQLYKESERLTNIKEEQEQKLSAEKGVLIKEHLQALQGMTQVKESELEQLQKEEILIMEEKTRVEKTAEIVTKEEQGERMDYRIQIEAELEHELKQEEQHKEQILGSITRLEKELSTYLQRASYFENLILDTRLQLNELMNIQEHYKTRKEYLRTELRDKEKMIERIEGELIGHLRNTEGMKLVKNTHEFELNENQAQVDPVSTNYINLENNVKQMNSEIMEVFYQKTHKTEQIIELTKTIEQLKETKQRKLHHKLEAKGKLERMEDELLKAVKLTSTGEIKTILLRLLGADNTDQTLHNIIEKEREESDRLIRRKTVLRKEIEHEERHEEQTLHNEHEIYRYHRENTSLIAEFNELKRTQKILEEQV